MSDDVSHPTEEQKHKDLIEGLKLLYDFFKHLTTLSTASLLLMATLLEKFFKAPSWTVLIGITFVGFFISLTSSLLSMKAVCKSITASGEMEGSETTEFAVGLVGSLGGMAIAIGALVTFSLRNFYS